MQISKQTYVFGILFINSVHRTGTWYALPNGGRIEKSQTIPRKRIASDAFGHKTYDFVFWDFKNIRNIKKLESKNKKLTQIKIKRKLFRSMNNKCVSNF